MRSVEQQLQAAIAQASPLSPLELSLRESRDCVLAADVTALYPIRASTRRLTTGAVVAQAVAGRVRVVLSPSPSWIPLPKDSLVMPQ